MGQNRDGAGLVAHRGQAGKLTDHEIAVQIAFQIDGGIARAGGLVAGPERHAAAQVDIAVDGGALHQGHDVAESPVTATDEPDTLVVVPPAVVVTVANVTGP